LTEILRYAKLILVNCFDILNCFLDNDCLWIPAIETLAVNSTSSLVRLEFFTETKCVLGRIDWPVVIPRLLNTGLDITMSFSIHLGKLCFFLICATLRGDKVFCVVTL
jgi:hypothetical protein